ncbi:hypothetical protein [Actinorugispora endophytica]|nr:hypothetical protein [Actinorugispora endophytica]
MSDYVPPAALPTHVLQRLDVQQALARKDFGRLFYLTRKWGGISYSKIAESCDIKPERVGTLARGKGGITTYDKIIQIADGMRIPGHFLGLLPRPWEAATASSSIAGQPGHPEVAAVELAGQMYESELLRHLGQQWHHLVKTDNLLGPRAALRGVCDQIRIIEELLNLASFGTALRKGLLSLAARYAESASWLYEDSGDVVKAHAWTDRAVQWAYEADDQAMLAWAFFRKSQQAEEPGNSIALAETAQRNRDALPRPMRSAIVQQQAAGFARIGDEQGAHRLFDQALEWAVDPDLYGDARNGHGSFCTLSYIELERARAWTVLGLPQRAVAIYDHVIPRMPVVYQRDRGVALARCAAAYTFLEEPEHAAVLAREALAIAHATGTGRAVNDLAAIAAPLRRHQALPVVKRLLNELDAAGEN